MKCWDLPSIKVGFANGAEIGLKIDEKFKEGHLVTFLKNYADGNGIGGNIITSRLLIKYTMENNTSDKSNVLKLLGLKLDKNSSLSVISSLLVSVVDKP